MAKQKVGGAFVELALVSGRLREDNMAKIQGGHRSGRASHPCGKGLAVAADQGKKASVWSHAGFFSRGGGMQHHDTLARSS